MISACWHYQSKPAQLCAFVDKVREIEGAIVEIGCWDGKTTSHIANTCFPDKVICNDVWSTTNHDALFRAFTYNMDTSTRGNYTVKKQDCRTFMESLCMPIKFLHIESSNDYDSVCSTITTALTKMARGGIICVDYLCSNVRGDVERAVRKCLPDAKRIGTMWYFKMM